MKVVETRSFMDALSVFWVFLIRLFTHLMAHMSIVSSKVVSQLGQAGTSDSIAS